MVRKNRSKWLIVLTTSMAAVLGGCGRSNTNFDPMASGLNGGIGIGGYSGISGCAPITGPIPFTGQVYFSAVNIIGGAVPGMGQSYGQLRIGGGGMGPFSRATTADGSITMNIIPQSQPYPNYYGGYGMGYGTSYGTGYNMGGMNSGIYPPGPAQVAGTIRLSPAVIQDIYSQVQMGYLPIGGVNNGVNGNNPLMLPNPQQICVSGVALNYGHSGTTLITPDRGSGVFLYLNNTQRGYQVLL